MLDKPGMLTISAATESLEAEGITYAYRKFGKSAARPLVLLQRFRGTMDEWDPALLDRLAETRQVVVFDNAGVGASTGTASNSVFGMADHAAAFIRAYLQGDGEAVDILGWSLGGITAFALALRQPELIHRMVVAGATPGGVKDARPAPGKVWEVAGRAVNTDEDFLYLFFPETDEGIADGKAHLERISARRQGQSPRVRPETVQAQFQALMATRDKDEMLSRLGEIKQPVLVANGVDDVMIHALASYAAVEKLPDGQCIIYPRSGHGFLFQRSAQFAQDVVTFLDR